MRGVPVGPDAPVASVAAVEEGVGFGVGVVVVMGVAVGRETGGADAHLRLSLVRVGVTLGGCGARRAEGRVMQGRRGRVLACERMTKRVWLERAFGLRVMC